MEKLYAHMEMPLMEVLFSMEQEGFALDGNVLKALHCDFSAQQKELEEKIYALAEKLCQTCGDNRSAECNGACYQTAVALYATFRKRACVLYHHGAYRRRLPDSDTAGILGIL